MPVAQSVRVREIVKAEYVARARATGKKSFVVSARDVLHKAEENPDFPRARTPLICNVLQSKKLLDENGLTIDRIEGPPSRQSRKVVVHYTFRDHEARISKGESVEEEKIGESAGDRAYRLGSKLLGLMKDEIAAHGGGEAYLRWVRGEDETSA